VTHGKFRQLAFCGFAGTLDGETSFKVNSSVFLWVSDSLPAFGDRQIPE
jgi:hypothetical protein